MVLCDGIIYLDTDDWHANEYETEVVCPHCGADSQTIWEREWPAEKTHQIQCDECGATLIVKTVED